MPTWPAQPGTKIFTSHHCLLETRWCEELILFLARHQRWRRRNDGGGAPHILFLTQYHSLSCRMASVEACTQSAQMELIFVRPVLSCPALTHFSWLYHAGIMCWFNKTAGVLFTFLLWIAVLGVYICIPWGGTGTYPVLYNIITYWIKQHHAQLDRKPWEEVEVLGAAGSLETALHHHVSRLIKPAAISWHVYQTNGVICSSDWDRGLDEHCRTLSSLQGAPLFPRLSVLADPLDQHSQTPDRGPVLVDGSFGTRSHSKNK